MKIQLDFRFDADTSVHASAEGLPLRNPLFALLDAIRSQRSIGGAAEQLGLSYRHVWGELKRFEGQFGRPLVAGGQGRAARLSELGERLLWAEKRALARLMPKAEYLAGQLEHELMLAVDPGLTVLPTCASHDLALGLLRDHMRAEARVLLDAEYVGSARALQRLNAGRCVLAGIHLPVGDERLCRRGGRIHTTIGRELRLGTHKLIRFARREQGLIVAADNPLGVTSLHDLLRPAVRFVNRQDGAGTRLLLDELLLRAAIRTSELAGYSTVEQTHLSVAAAVAAGEADCGFGLRAAGERFGLGFVPLIAEEYFLVCLKQALDSPEIQALIALLGRASFRERVSTIPGYAFSNAGEIMSLRRTLPWYK